MEKQIRPCHKTGKNPRKSNQVSSEQMAVWDLKRSHGCVICGNDYGQNVEIHHIETKMGSQKNHDLVIPLCWAHHSPYSPTGRHSMARNRWEREVAGATEREMLARVDAALNII